MRKVIQFYLFVPARRLFCFAQVRTLGQPTKKNNLEEFFFPLFFFFLTTSVCYCYKETLLECHDAFSSVPIKDLEAQYFLHHKVCNPSAAGIATFVFQPQIIRQRAAQT